MDTKKALSLTAAMCSKKEYCRQDIIKKLEQWEIAEKEWDTVLDYLTKNKFIDEARFAAFYARDKFRFNKWGKIKIAHSLKQKGIPPDIIREALQLLPAQDQEETCLYLLRQKMKSIKENEPVKIKAKLMRFASGRGFDFDTIGRCLNMLEAELRQTRL